MTWLSRLQRVHQQLRDRILAERVAGHWVGELASSACSTATAVSAAALARDAGCTAEWLAGAIAAGSGWLLEAQREDGGWGDTDRNYSNISTTMLSAAALVLSGSSDPRIPAAVGRADRAIEEFGGVAGLRARYGRDRTFAVPILTNAALAGRAPWREITPLPFEAACVPQQWYRFLQLPVVSYAIPALVAIGQARFHHRPPWFLPSRWLRRAAQAPSLRVLERMQPASGGFLEATPLTSFVVMSLASIGQVGHPVAQRGLEFIRQSMRADGSWPIDTNLATWNTTLALNALAAGGDRLRDLPQAETCLQWLLECQHRERHPYTGAAPGGWGWTDLSGAVPDADDTPGALLALSAFAAEAAADEPATERIERAARSGIDWLLGLQNRDGGWPTFCRGWGKLPFDRSGSDLTAHALRALNAWRRLWAAEPSLAARVARATQRGLAYLGKTQAADGCWTPLWFGNQDHPQEENPVYGTAKVLLAYRDLGQIGTPEAQRGLQWVARGQNPDGGWGGNWPCRGAGPGAPAANSGGPGKRAIAPPVGYDSSIEETALAVEALLAHSANGADGLEEGSPLAQGLHWLLDRCDGWPLETSPIGFYFAKLWYHERLYPPTFALAALGTALRKFAPGAVAAQHAPPS